VDGLITDLNSAHTTTRGDLIYKGASAVGRLAVGTSGEVLVSDGTDPTWGMPSAKTFMRPYFTYNGGATAYTIKAAGGQYWCKDKYCYWNSELTTAAIGSPAADDWFYLYLDYSAITSGTAITNSEFLWADTEPAFNHTYNGWYNGDDLCIFAVLCNSVPNNIVEFFHDGGSLVSYYDEIPDYTNADPGTDFSTEVTFSAPSFVRRVKCYFLTTYVDGAPGYSYWRNTDSAAGTIIVGTVAAGTTKSTMESVVYCNASSKIDIAVSANDTVSVQTLGWYLPSGI